jgi:hypothetical protein
MTGMAWPGLAATLLVYAVLGSVTAVAVYRPLWRRKPISRDNPVFWNWAFTLSCCAWTGAFWPIAGIGYLIWRRTR